jgi:radical SAM protein (TIGR01212 family)
MNRFKYTSTNKRYHTWDYYLKSVFGEKVAKVSLDGGFTCPNIDGTISRGGCIFCSKRGSGDFALEITSENLKKQFEAAKNSIRKKWPGINKYIAYFQAYSNTYADIKILREKYETVLSLKNVVGLSIATRADILDKEILEYLGELNKKTFLWVELGLQSSNDKTAQLINRGHDFRTFMKAAEQLRERNIKVCVHIINGLPGETYDDMIKTVKDISVLDINAVKIHMLYILKDTPLFKLYEKEKFSVMKREDYIQTVADQIELLPEEVIVERVTGDGKADDLKAPLWSLNKISILNDIDKELVRRNTWQGIKRNIEV